MRKLILAFTLVAAPVAAVVVPAAPAHADGQFCHSINVVVNGQSVVDNSSCDALPALPAIPLP